MVTLVDVLHRIGFDTSMEGDDSTYDFNVCITNDIEASKADFIRRYGPGKVYNFELESYQHGRKLASAFYQHLTGKPPVLSASDLTRFPPNDILYLLVHVRRVKII